MLDAIRHRGPDETGTYVDDDIALGCDRLAIVDVQGGAQPATTEDCNVWVVLNGEIYNHRELRATLQQMGHRFSSLSDTEVIGHAYEQWGERMLGKLEGMFAFSVWDTTKRMLMLARDRVGIKPLYYTCANLDLAFSSEAKAILAADVLDVVTVNPVAVEQLLEVGYLLSSMSMFKEIKQLPPASFLKLSNGLITTGAYWKTAGHRDDHPAIEEIRNALRSSVLRQTETSDVPVAAFLSGGLDTSTVVAFASKVRPEGLRTFCMGFGEHTDEFKDARAVAELFGTDHHEILIDSSQGMKLLPRMIWHSEMPKVNLYSWFVNEAASKFSKVCLSGLGGDEIFCGYPTSARFRRARQVSNIMRFSPLNRLAAFARVLPTEKARYAQALNSEVESYCTIITGFPPPDLDPTIPESIKEHFQGKGDFVEKIVRCEFHTKLPHDYLLVEDAMSMAHSLEVRVPLLDDSLVGLMLGVPIKYQMTSDTGKLLLRSAMKGILPESCFAKPKWGFSVDVYSWWKGALGEYAMKYLPESKTLTQIAARWYPKVLEKIQLPPDPSRTRWYAMAWTMLGLEYWNRMFIEERGKQPSCPDL